MPFTQAEFFDVFAALNSAWWPVVGLLWVAAAWFAGQLVGLRLVSRAMRLFLAVLWTWTGVAYHAMFFSRINPAAWAFAAMFVVQAALFVWWTRADDVGKGPSRPGALALVFLLYSLAYPGLVVMSGHAWPRAPIFGVPCPVVLFTTGVFLASPRPVPRRLLVIPILWSLIGGSAAFLFAMRPDVALIAGGIILATRFARPRRALALAAAALGGVVKSF